MCVAKLLSDLSEGVQGYRQDDFSQWYSNEIKEIKE